MKHMNNLSSALRHRDNKYWVPSEGLNDASSGNCRIVILVPNECLKDSSSGKMQSSNTGAKRVSERLLERKMRNNNATVGRRGDTT